jgi:fluoride exporter
MKTWIVRSIAIGAAGFVGAVARYAIGTLFGRLNIRFPAGTMFINLSGSFFLGWFLTYVTAHNVSPTMRLAIATGFVGAYTTFSTYMFESNQLLDEGAGISGTVNLLGSLILGLIAVRLGIYFAGGYRK